MAQQEHVRLLGESGDGRIVKLIWFFKSWDPKTTGFDVKRRNTGDGPSSQWESLNPSPIVPGISLEKQLLLVEKSNTEQIRLNDKLRTLIAQKKTREIPSTDYLQRLATDTNALEGLSFAIAMDYDLALINGFALVDRTAAEGNTYEYGLFLVSGNRASERPVATFSWKQGTAAMLDPPVMIKSNPLAKNNHIQLVWNLPDQQLPENMAGFNVYKRSGGNWTKLNYGPIAARNNPSGFSFVDTTTSLSQRTTYAISLQSMFGNEGRKVEYTYDPADHPLTLKAPDLGNIAAAGDNYENGFVVNWTFPKDYERFLKGFIVEKANLPAGYQTVSKILSPLTRRFIENSFSPPASYIQFKVTAIYKDEEKLASNEKLFYYLPVIYAPKPTNLKGNWVKENKKTFINLSWDPKSASDTLTEGYQIFASSRFDDKLYLEGSLPLIKQNNFRYEVFNKKAGTYRFTIAAVNKYKAVGHFSDTIIVNTPSVELPVPVIYPYSLDTARKVTLEWTYDSLADLKGFRVYQNGNMVASEFELKRDARKFVSPPLKLNDTYLFTIQAVTNGGEESERSMPRDIYIFKKSKN